MRKYIYSIFLLGLFSCQEEGVVQYTQEKDGLQFSANSSEDMTKVFNFATATYEEEINGEPKTFYYGDSLAAYTFERVVLDLQGFPTPDEREYKLKPFWWKTRIPARLPRLCLSRIIAWLPIN